VSTRQLIAFVEVSILDLHIAVTIMSLLTAVCRANQGILTQKLGLMKALITKHGNVQAEALYKTTCPIVKATIGQHIRHSMDHMERAVAAAAASVRQQQQAIHYDLRERDTLDEHDWVAAEARIQRVSTLLQDLSTSSNVSPNQPVDAFFMLSGDSSTEYILPSTIARELGFAAHHAIHHMAMIKIMATCPVVGGLSDADLPPDFGRAPSTVNNDHAVKKQWS
jgi:hypothetical protein